MKLKNLETEIKIILETLEYTRENDMYLYYTYCTAHNCGAADRFRLLFLDDNFRRENKICGYESVSRCRRKLQEKYSHLQNKLQAEVRKNQEEAFVEYARSK